MEEQRTELGDYSMEEPKITMVIATSNSMSEGKRLDLTLLSLEHQTRPAWEVIVVDNCSIDSTSVVAARFHVRFFSLRSTIASAYNLALKHVTGDFVFFLDSDMVLPRDFVEEATLLIRSRGVDCLAFRMLFLSEPEKNVMSTLEYLRNLETVLGGEPSDGIYFYSRKILSGENYPEKIPVLEDYFFRMNIMRKNPRIGYLQGIVLHYHQGSFTWLVRRSLRYGATLRAMRSPTPMKLSVIRKYGLLPRESDVTSRIPIGVRKTLVVFPFYLLLKYMAFGVGFLTRSGEN
jgi:glycosyltransferase involved in cell wall biosynthesis